MKYYHYILIFVILLIITVEPTVATNETQVEQIEFDNLLYEFIKFIANLLEMAANMIREGVEILT